MEYSVIMAGFGGQGVLLMGDLLAYGAMKKGLNVTWMPAYGVEMRGGAANCTVVLSEDEIGAPLVGSPRAVIAMSEPAYDKFKNLLPESGLLMVNSSLIQAPDGSARRKDIEMVLVPAQALAEESGDEKMANVAMLGAFLAHTGLLEPEDVAGLARSFMPPEKGSLVPAIERALLKGKEFINSR
ncbi:MAG: 2-oxoacid:acceptor oxidoreductase family protein [Bacillota bacterium]